MKAKKSRAAALLILRNEYYEVLYSGSRLSLISKNYLPQILLFELGLVAAELALLPERD